MIAVGFKRRNDGCNPKSMSCLFRDAAFSSESCRTIPPTGQCRQLLRTPRIACVRIKFSRSILFREGFLRVVRTVCVLSQETLQSGEAFLSNEDSFAKEISRQISRQEITLLLYVAPRHEPTS